jgi:hypothetical protein
VKPPLRVAVRGTWGLLLLAVFWIQSSSAQDWLSFSGYIMDVPVYQRVNGTLARFFAADRDQWLNVARVRLRPTASLWGNARLSLEYEITSLYHSDPLFFDIQTTRNKRQVVDMTWNPVNDPKYSVIHFVDRLHFDGRFGFADVVIGRQRIAWGTGRIWNPTDLFNPINPTAFAKIEKDGVDAVLTKLTFGDFTDLTLVYNPQEGWKTSNEGFRFRTNYDEYDLAIVGGHFDKRVIVGGDFAGNLFQAGVRGEAILSADRHNLRSYFASTIFGIDYQFTSKLYALAEYHFNGEGTTDKSSYDLLRLARGEIINVGRNYLALQASYLVHPLVNAMLSYMRNLDDRSQFFGLLVTCSVTDELAVALGGQLYKGDDFSEFWYYPGAAYLKADFYF